MKDGNIWEPDQPKDGPQAGNTSQHIEKQGNSSKPYRDGRILAYNLLALALYTLLSGVSGGGPCYRCTFFGLSYFSLLYIGYCI